MKLNYLLFCDRADRTESQKMILHGIIDSVIFEEEPTKEKPRGLGSIGIAYEVLDPELKKKENILGLRITDPDGDVIFDGPTKLGEKNEKGKKWEKITGFGNIPLAFTKSGNYKLVLSINEVVVGETVLKTKIKDKD